MGFTAEKIKTYQYAEEQTWASVPIKTRKLRIRLINDNHVITYQYSQDQGQTWQLHPTRMEASGMHHNVFGGFLSLKVGIYSSGNGKVQSSDFRYSAI